MPRRHPEESPPPPRPAGERLLLLLKMRGPQTTADLGAALKITGEAARQQLVKLAADGLVETTSRPRGVGRPAQVWRLTGKGHARFPDTHAELTVHLLSTIRSELGEAALDKLIAARAVESLATYTAALEGAASLGERVARLAEARTQWHAAIAERGDFLPAWLGLGECALRCGGNGAAEEVARALEALPNGKADAEALRARAASLR